VLGRSGVFARVLGSRGIESPGFASAGIVDAKDEEEAAILAFGAEFDLVSTGRIVERTGRFERGLGGVVPVPVGSVLFDKPASLQEVLGSISVSEKPEVSNAGESRRENMEKEPTEELVGVQGHDASSIAAGVVLPGESDAVLVEGEDAAVGYGDAVSIAGEVLEDLARPSEGGLCVNEPFLVA
jgi:hypothetical protein